MRVKIRVRRNELDSSHSDYKCLVASYLRGNEPEASIKHREYLK
jgi:hypothetical protein